MRETDNHLLILVGGLTWLAISGYFIDDIDQTGGHMPILALTSYALIAALLAGGAPDTHEG
ncbi:hypothetical protein [Streptomyces alboflavus]|uniref:hypothetical protein n=1 Tax=Streptomyces alboflavus TaxID=67267 RepID=UPI0036A683EB